MMHRMSRGAVWFWTVLVIVTALMISPFRAGLQAGSVMGGKLEIFSWWTWGREADGLNALFEIFRQRYPDVEIVNAAIAGGPPEDAVAILKARMQRGKPPDSFQAHGGEELTSPWVVTGHMEPITQLFESEGWLAVFPRNLVNIVTYQGDQYSVPVSVHRGNVLWYNKKIFDDNKLAAPTSWDEFFKVANTLRAKGITPLALGDQNKWESAHLLEDVLLGTSGAFLVISAAFSLPKKAPHRDQALNWLRVAGSKEGQEALNQLKGALCARTDCDPMKLDTYMQSAAKDFAKNVVVPSEVHGSAAPPGFTVAFNDIVHAFVSNKDVGAAQRALQKACGDNKMCM